MTKPESIQSEPIIRVRNLVARYGDNLILDDINLDVKHGEIFVILGSSGCGKSTLLRHMAGLDRAHTGQVVVDGNIISQGDNADFRKAIKKIGILFQGSALLGSMTLAQNVALPLGTCLHLPKDITHRLVVAKLAMVDLAGYENYLPSEISGGMKKRAGLARALVCNPLILFLDEPTAGLDPITSAEIDALILRINRLTAMTVVIVTHELSSIFTLAQRVIMLDKKTKGIIAQGDPRYLRDHSENEYVKQFFKSKTEAT